MQYGFVALGLSFFLHKSWFYFSLHQRNFRSLYYEVFYHDMVPPTDVSLPKIIISCPQLNYQSGVESSEIDPSPEAQIVRNRGHG